MDTRYSNINFDLFPEEIYLNDVTELDRDLNVSKDFILYMNIRSLNGNYKNLEILIETMKIKPIVIVCVVMEYWIFK